MRRIVLRSLSRFGLASWLGALHAGCGVYLGEPTHLFQDATADGGTLPASGACVLSREPVSGTSATLASGATATELLSLASHPYIARVSWLRGGASTWLHMQLSNLTVSSVESIRNPSYPRARDTPICMDHAAIEGALDIFTDDGLLAEHIEPVQLVAYDDFEAHGTFTLDRGALLGWYGGTARAGQCFVRLKIRLMIARDGTHGSLGEILETAYCDDEIDGPTNEVAAAHWGTRWMNYGD